MLRAIGFTPGQVWSAIVVMAATTAAIGAVVGTLVGVAVGSFVWRSVVGALGIPTPPDVPPLTIAAVTLSLFAASVVVAAIPAHRASRIKPAVLLRQE